MRISRISKADLIADLQRVSREEGAHTYLVYGLAGRWSSQTVLTHFGTWNRAIQAAGLTLNRAGRKPNDCARK